MITAIIGKAGSGKSIISKVLSSNYDGYVESDSIEELELIERT